ncbi:hydrogenase expression/formation protein HypE [Desulfotomaculum defluvii]
MNQTTSEVILLSHGDGGALTAKLIDQLFHKYFTSTTLKNQGDAAIVAGKQGRLAITTDSFVVTPVFFPGGDLGKLSVYGTINDLAVSGAKPKYLTAAFVLEEGLPMATLERIISSMAEACCECGVEIIAGDTKVVERGQVDKIFITTTGVGWINESTNLGYHRVAPGDSIIVNGTLGDHGIAILTQRLDLNLENQIFSDCAPLEGVVGELLQAFSGIKIMRDLTRGGLATGLKEIALACGVDVWLEEGKIPISTQTQGISNFLGLNPLYIANEGKFTMFVASGQANSALKLLQQHPLGKGASIIGEVKAGKGNVYLKTILGGTKVLDLMAGTPLPRIC